jgi:hypothetical protein
MEIEMRKLSRTVNAAAVDHHAMAGRALGAAELDRIPAAGGPTSGGTGSSGGGGSGGGGRPPLQSN